MSADMCFSRDYFRMYLLEYLRLQFTRVVISLFGNHYCQHQRIQHKSLLYPNTHHRYSCWKFITVQCFLSTFGVISTEIYYNTTHDDKSFSISSEAILLLFILKWFMLKLCCWTKIFPDIILDDGEDVIAKCVVAGISWTEYFWMNLSECICQNTLDVNIITGNIFI